MLKHLLPLVFGVFFTFFSVSALSQNQSLSGIWVNSGLEKIPSEEMRATKASGAITNRLWDGRSIRLSGARNETVHFNLILESVTGVNQASVRLKELVKDKDNAIVAHADTASERSFLMSPIELFLVDYLEIKGLSRTTWSYDYDERHMPEKFRRPYNAEGKARGTWKERPHGNLHYPEIAFPLSLKPTFKVAPSRSQSVWVDIYIPKGLSAGIYKGNVIVEYGAVVKKIPVVLKVLPITLSDEPAVKTMVSLSSGNLQKRYLPESQWYTQEGKKSLVEIEDYHFQLAHRHRVSLFTDDIRQQDKPSEGWIPRLDGSLFTLDQGYFGAGAGYPNDIYIIGPYSSWTYVWIKRGRPVDARSLQLRTDNWVTWFSENFPHIDYYLYLVDESNDYKTTEQWSKWIHEGPGVGRNISTFATLDILKKVKEVPSLKVTGHLAAFGPKKLTEDAARSIEADASKKLVLYNGRRPGVGSFATEDEGVSLMVSAWAAYKKKIDRWFYWEATYYNDFQGGRGDTNVFTTAQTFGSEPERHPVLGEAGWNYTNGDGVLFYPGTDLLFPEYSNGVRYPFASLRLKFWRRGIEDVAYIKQAAKIDRQKTMEIVNKMVPKVLWEVGVAEMSDPTWIRTDISWSTDPDDWIAAREKLAKIIMRDSSASHAAENNKF